MSRRVTVHHFVANKVTRQHGPGSSARDLLDVDYWRSVPGDTEFPKVFGRLDVFTRFYLSRAKPTDFLVKVWWEDNPRRRRELVGEYGPFRVPFQPGDLVLDRVFRLYNLEFRGTGRHTIRLIRDRAANRSPLSRRWVTIAQTHFTVERTP